MTAANEISHSVTSGDLIAQLASYAEHVGANTGLWPGLTVYRFTQPARLRRTEITGLSLCVIAQGRKAVTGDGQRYLYHPFHYLVVDNRTDFQRAILQASRQEPCLCLVLQIEPDVVRGVSARMTTRPGVVGHPQLLEANTSAYAVSALDDEMMSTVLRFLRSLSSETDRRVLAPLYLQELVYRLLQRHYFIRMPHLAPARASTTGIAPALNYIGANLSGPLTVPALARQVGLSSSAFTRAFREVTGTSPYQFVKELRLTRAGELLIEGRLGVAGTSRAVGYSSTSHFIKEFRSRFGTTPSGYTAEHFGGRTPRRVKPVRD